jgi:hypothetical protein
LEDLDKEVTFISTIHCTPTGVLVIVNVVKALVVVLESVKNGALPDPSSFLALTSIFTPAAGIADFTSTVNVNGSIDGS